MAKYMNIWTLPKFRIEVKWDNIKDSLNFEEVKGLEFEDEHLEYRGGADNEYFKSRPLGLPKYSNITLKRGTLKNPELYKKLFEKFVDKSDLSIHLIDDKRKIYLKWELKNVSTKTIKGIDLKPKDSKITIKSLELKHEGMTMKQEK